MSEQQPLEHSLSPEFTEKIETALDDLFSFWEADQTVPMALDAESLGAAEVEWDDLSPSQRKYLQVKLYKKLGIKESEKDSLLVHEYTTESSGDPPKGENDKPAPSPGKTQVSVYKTHYEGEVPTFLHEMTFEDGMTTYTISTEEEI